METGHFSFTVIRGRQGENDYYLTQCLLRLVPRIFLFDEVDVPTVLRRVRSLDTFKVDGIKHYLISQPNDYIMAPLIVAVDCEVVYQPLVENLSEIGHLQIPLTARMIIHDGQHRRAAIQRALNANPNMGDDTIPVVILPDPELVRSPRLYNDLNYAYVRRNLSLRILHDQDNPLAGLAQQLAHKVSLFRGRTELEKTTISNRSTALFTLSAIYQATQALLNVGKRDSINSEQSQLAQYFWEELGQTIPEWQQIIQGKVTSARLRQMCVHAHTVTLIAIGIVGHDLIATYPDDWQEQLGLFGKLDWSRENTTLWEGRAIVRGRMSKSRDSVGLTAIAIKQKLELPLTEKEQSLEQRLES